MSSIAHVSIHASQFPDRVGRDLVESLGARRVNHKFHYQSVKQAQQWLALHRAYSPWSSDPDCQAVYQASYEAVGPRLAGRRVHLVGLGCGGGQKELRLLEMLARTSEEVFYTPSDVSTPMVLLARQLALRLMEEGSCSPLVCDLATADDLPEVLETLCAPHAARLFTFFGMLPNFEPHLILPKLASLIRPEDVLLFSANLAPGADYDAAMRRILPLYDNALTREWLMSFLLDHGFAATDGRLVFCVENDPAGAGLKRVAADFVLSHARQLSLDLERFVFSAGDSLRLFFSYRHTPSGIRILLARHGLEVCAEWITQSQEEGVFLVLRSGGSLR